MLYKKLLTSILPVGLMALFVAFPLTNNAHAWFDCYQKENKTALDATNAKLACHNSNGTNHYFTCKKDDKRVCDDIRILRNEACGWNVQVTDPDGNTYTLEQLHKTAGC